jgi:signal transduction histidine kinase
MYRRSEAEMRVVVLAPVGGDAELIANTLTSAGFAADICQHPENLVACLVEGAGTAVVAEEAIQAKAMEVLAAWLAAQPAWSDMPVVVLTSDGRPTPLNVEQAQDLEALGNFTLLERPVRPETLVSSVRAALRARMRQYQMRSREEALVRANTDLEQFAHSASHDLREPLRGIGVYSELLASRYAEQLNGQGQQYLNFVRAGAARMEMLINALLEYAQAASIGEEQVEPAGASAPLGAAISNLAEAIKESGAQVVACRLPAVRMREIHLQQLFQNLIGNAIKYRGTEPLCVQVGAERDDRWWRFRVQDNGIGIKPEYREVIFGIFKRLHSKDKYSGTGMGLAICQRIVERYRGRIWVESEPGRGSTFFFTVAA